MNRQATIRLLLATALALCSAPSAIAGPSVLVDSVGAIADGRTDCRKAIQNAFARMRAAGGGTVRFRPKAVYLVSDTVGSTSLDDRMANVTVDGRGAVLLCMLERQPRPALRMMGSRLRVRDLTIRYTRRIEPVRDRYVQGGDAIYIGGSADSPETDVRVDRCRIEGAWFAGIRPAWASKVVIADCTLSRCLATSIFATEVRDGLWIVRNRITDSKDDGIFVAAGPNATATDGVTIISNTIRGGSGKGIGIGGVHNAVIARNAITNTWASGIACEQNGFSGDQTRTIRIVANTINDVGRNYGPGRYHAQPSPTAIGIYIAATSTGDFGHIQIARNTIARPLASGIAVAHAGGVAITENTITDCRGMGIVVGLERGSSPQATDFVVARNTIDGTGRAGVYVVGATRGVVAANRVRSFGRLGNPNDRGVFVYRTDGVVTASNVVESSERLTEPVRVAQSTRSPLRGGGRTVILRGSPPTSGEWSAGDLALAPWPQPDGLLGWECVEGGSPGRWRELTPSEY